MSQISKNGNSETHKAVNSAEHANAFRSFLRDLGLFLHIPAALSISAFIVILAFNEWFALLPFALLATASLVCGQLLFRLNQGYKNTFPGSAYALVAVVWLLLPLFGAIPFYGIARAKPDYSTQIGIFANVHNALFESFSGFTGTGLTMLNDPSVIPHSLQWWRSITEWLGGLGIIFLAVAFLGTSHENENLYQSEAMDWSVGNKSIHRTVMKIWWIYLAYSFLAIVLFQLAGMPFWEALNHGLTGISTGGFTITSNSFTTYTSTIKLTAIAIMLLGSISFKVHYLLVIRFDWRNTWKQTQLRYFLALLIAFLLVLLILNPKGTLVDELFQLVSALGTCGFSASSLSNWAMPVLLLLLFAMFIGGNENSTTGGLKTSRFAKLVKGIVYHVRTQKLPEEKLSEIDYWYNGEEVPQQEVMKEWGIAGGLLFMFGFFVAVGTLAIAVLVGDQYKLHEILFDVTSAISNVGLSSGITGSSLPSGVKWILIFLMWAGRLEFYGVLILLLSPFKPKTK